ncbi:hypothetical protein [Desulfosporosinus fructosivorans]
MPSLDFFGHGGKGLSDGGRRRINVNPVLYVYKTVDHQNNAKIRNPYDKKRDGTIYSRRATFAPDGDFRQP